MNDLIRNIYRDGTITGRSGKTYPLHSAIDQEESKFSLQPHKRRSQHKKNARSGLCVRTRFAIHLLSYKRAPRRIAYHCRSFPEHPVGRGWHETSRGSWSRLLHLSRAQVRLCLCLEFPAGRRGTIRSRFRGRLAYVLLHPPGFVLCNTPPSRWRLFSRRRCRAAIGGARGVLRY